MALSLKTVVFSDGERYPMLLDEAGIPDWNATLFITTQLRNASKASNTMAAVLGAIRLLFVWADRNRVDFEVRFAEREFLTREELESIRQHTQTLVKEEPDDMIVARDKRPRRIETARAVVHPRQKSVSSATQYIRLTYIANFIHWLSVRVVEQQSKQLSVEDQTRIKAMVEGIRRLRPVRRTRSLLNARKALSQQDQSRLRDLVQVATDENVFHSDLHKRNKVIVELLLSFGLRAGELLALKVGDFDFQTNEVVIARRPDDVEDPRAKQPTLKTLDRRLAMSQPLAKMVMDYVMTDRSKVRPARKHPFLLVTMKPGPFYGRPLSYDALAKLFPKLRDALGADVSLSAHVLRHSANENLSRLYDEQKAEPAEEEKVRSYMMGWREGSGTAAIYTRRHIEEKAKEASLKLQKRITNDE